jgi:hypothetical protein
MLVLTAAPEDALLFPVAARELVAAFRAELDAIEAALVVLLLAELPPDVLLALLLLPELLEELLLVLDLDVVGALTVPITALVVSVPDAVPPAVLT